MKFLLLVFVVLVLVWKWRTRHVQHTPPTGTQTRKRTSRTPQAVAMVECRQCGLHLPGSDAVYGVQGAYCSAQHQRDGERA